MSEPQVFTNAVTTADAGKTETPKTITSVQGNLQKQPALTPETPNGASGNTAALSQDKADERNAVTAYKVQDGDTLSGIAARFSITTQTLVWANTLDNPNSLKPGSEIRVPPTSGVLHTVKPGDTLISLAEKYKVDISDITGFSANRINNPDALVLGQEITIPRGVKPVEAPVQLVGATQPLPAATARPAAQVSAPAAPAPAAPAPAAPAQLPAQPVAGGVFQWPTYGPIFTFFSAGHRGLDISPPYGTPVYAAEGGIVVEAALGGYNDGYGNYIMVDHGNGFKTRYAHLSSVLVSVGQRIGRGENIGRVGATGRATGPHLHFEVYRGGVPVDPLGYLPR